MSEEKKCLLSISMLMSGRAETEKCLQSLVPFMEQMPCEIIVVDTGCDDETRKIIEKYTDHIIPFSWCSDFSKARNVGLEAAKGEWFLYLDDDEWFEDPTDIITFFTSGEYQNYQSACYMQRNYSDYGESSYSDAAVSRMVKLEPNTCFRSSIHEYLCPIKGPVKLFDTYVKHFGYIFKSNKDKYEHSKRNVELLIDMMKKEPMEFRWDTHILQEYWGIGEMSKLIEVATNAIAKYKRKNIHDMGDRRSLGTFYGYLAEGYGRKFDEERQRKAIEEGLCEKGLTRLAKAFLYKSAIYLNYTKERYEGCVAAYEHYMSAYDKLGNDKQAMYEQGGLLIGDTFQKEKVQDAMLHGMMAAAKIGRDDIIERDFYKLGWTEKRMLLHPHFQQTVIRRMVERPIQEYDISMAKTMAERENNISGVVKVLQGLEEEYQRNNSEKLEENVAKEGISEEEIQEETYEECQRKNACSWENLITIFSQVESNHWYITYLKILKASSQNASEEIQPLFDRLCAHVFDIFNLNNRLWQIAEEYHIDMELFFLRMDFDTWRDGITQWMMHTNLQDLAYKERLVRLWKKEDNIRYDFFFMKMKEGRVLYYDFRDEDFQDFEDRILEYANAVTEYYQLFYTENAFRMYLEAMPHECRTAVGLMQVIVRRRETDSREILDMIKPMIDVYPPMNQTLKRYITMYGTYLEHAEQKKVDEMQELAEKLKARAKELLDFGQIEEALQILNQLHRMLPQDSEIAALINRYKCE